MFVGQTMTKADVKKIGKVEHKNKNKGREGSKGREGREGRKGREHRERFYFSNLL